MKKLRNILAVGALLVTCICLVGFSAYDQFVYSPKEYDKYLNGLADSTLLTAKPGEFLEVEGPVQYVTFSQPGIWLRQVQTTSIETAVEQDYYSSGQPQPIDGKGRSKRVPLGEVVIRNVEVDVKLRYWPRFHGDYYLREKFGVNATIHVIDVDQHGTLFYKVTKD